jgi:hypothetical protein
VARARVHKNASPALRMLGGAVGSSWHGRGSVHGRSQAGLARGIDPWVQCEAGGEVMAQGVVGGVLTKHGVHHRQWRHPGCRRGGAG